MLTVTLSKWGNSMGIRVPADLVKEARLYPGEKFTIKTNKQGGILLIPINDPQQGWTEAFNAIADADNDELLINIENEFDLDEWKW